MEKFVINIGRQLGSGGRTVGEIIARRLGISINTVKTQKYRGYRSLRLKLSKFVFLFGSLLALFADLK